MERIRKTVQKKLSRMNSKTSNSGSGIDKSDSSNRSRVSAEKSQKGNEKIENPLDTDILLGRSKASWNHVGNRRFRVFVGLHLKQYMEATTRLEKTMVVNLVVEAIQEAGGRFLKQSKDKTWYIVHNKLAREKVGHALRDAVGNRIKLTTDESQLPPSIQKAALLRPNQRRQSNIVMERRRSNMATDHRSPQQASQQPAGRRDLLSRQSKSCNNLETQSDMLRDARKVALELGEEGVLQDIETIVAASKTAQNSIGGGIPALKGLESLRAASTSAATRPLPSGYGSAVKMPPPNQGNGKALKNSQRSRKSDIMDSGEFSLMSVNPDIFEDFNQAGSAEKGATAGGAPAAGAVSTSFTLKSDVFDDLANAAISSSLKSDPSTQAAARQVDKRMASMDFSEEFRRLGGVGASLNSLKSSGTLPVLAPGVRGSANISIPLEEISVRSSVKGGAMRRSNRASAKAAGDAFDVDLSEDFSVMSIGDAKATLLANPPNGPPEHVPSHRGNGPAKSALKRPSGKPMEVKAKAGWEMDISEDFSIDGRRASAKLTTEQDGQTSNPAHRPSTGDFSAISGLSKFDPKASLGSAAAYELPDNMRASFSDIEFSEEFQPNSARAGGSAMRTSSRSGAKMRQMLSEVQEASEELDLTDPRMEPRPLAKPAGLSNSGKSVSISVPLNDTEEGKERKSKGFVDIDQSDNLSVDTEKEWKRTLQALSSTGGG